MEGLPPPEGGDRDRGSIILGITWTLTLISLIFVCLRMYSRIRLVQRIWWDDWLAVIAVVSFNSYRRRIEQPDELTFKGMRFTATCHLDFLCPQGRCASCLLSISAATGASRQTQLGIPAFRYHGYRYRESFGGIYNPSVSSA